jgi:hypothetical protein
MGVVHKLKQEVIDFIVRAKREEPRMSVRGLADLAGRKFQIEISKSSISNVLKNNSLSSPVGRPARPKKEKIFMIPAGAKERIRGEMKKIGLAAAKADVPPGADQADLKAVAPAASADAEVRDLTPEGRREAAVSEDRDPETVLEKSPVPGIIPEPPQKPEEIIPRPESLPENSPAGTSAGENPPPEPEFKFYQEAPGSAWEEDEEKAAAEEGREDAHLKLLPDPVAEAYEGTGPAPEPVPEVAGTGLVDAVVESAEERPAAGALILYAVAQALTGKAFFADLLAEDISRHDLPDFDQLCQAEIFYQWLGSFVSMAPEVVDQSALWPALGFSRPPDRGVFRQRLEGFRPAEIFKMKYATEREQLDIEVTGFKVVLSEGAFYIDAFNREAGLKPPVRAPFGRPLNLAVFDLAQQIISGRRPLIIRHLPDNETAPAVLRYLCPAGAGQQGGPSIKRAALLDFQGEEMASFNAASGVERIFLIGIFPAVGPASGRAGEFLKKVQSGAPRETEIPAGGKAGRYRVYPVEAEEFTRGEDGCEGLKLLAVETGGRDVFFLTNGGPDNIPEMLDKYAGRWGFTGCSEIEQTARCGVSADPAGARPPGEDWPEIRSFFVDFGEYLADKAVAWLFPAELSREDKRSVLRALCLLPGKVTVKADALIILINIQKVAPDLQKNIGIIINQFNKYDFYDAKGRKIYLTAY